MFFWLSENCVFTCCNQNKNKDFGGVIVQKQHVKLGCAVLTIVHTIQFPLAFFCKDAKKFACFGTFEYK